MNRLLSWCALVIAIAGFLVAPAHAQNIQKPSAAKRIVRVFDFEEQAIHGDPVPMHWVRAQDDAPIRHRPGFPPWNHAAFDLTISHSGSASLKLPTQGGSTALEFVPGVLPVIPGGDYEISAMVRTTPLKYARARLVAQLCDATLTPIPESEQSTALLGPLSDWTHVKVQIPGTFPKAAWLTIQLELLQQSAFPPELESTVGSDLVDRAEDISGAAWFDDVTVRIVPVLSLRTQHDSSVIDAGTTPLITGIVDDVVGDHLTATMQLIDIDGNVRDAHHVEDVRPGASIRWEPVPPEFGWWTVQLNVASNGDPLAEESLDFVWIPTPANLHGRPRQSIALQDGLNVPQKVLLDLLDGLGAGAVDVPFWIKGSSKASVSESIPQLTYLLEQLLARQFNVTLALESAPADLAAELRIGDDEVLDALSSGRKVWSPWLDEALTRFGQRVRRWRVGDLEDIDLRDPLDIAEQFVTASKPLTDGVLNPVPTLPWLAEVEAPAALDAVGVSINWPATMRPESIVDLAPTWDGVKELTVVIEPLSDQHTDRKSAAIDFSKRMVRAWQANPHRIAMAQPWTWRTVRHGNTLARPTPEFAVWSRMGEHLRGRRIVGELPITDGVVALVLDGDAGGAIILWNEWAQPNQAELRAYLGPDEVTAFDIFGNSHAAPFSEGVHKISISESPLIIEGVDAELARFRAGFRVDPGHIESTAERHALELVVANPWPVAISGDLQIVAPSSWSFTPQTISFTIAPGEESRFPIETAFGLAEEAGEHTIRARTRLVATERYPTITVDAPIELSLTGIELIPSYQVRREAGGDSVIVTLLVINTGEEPTTLMAFAQAPGAKRQQAPISNLPPRGAAVRSFVFRHALQDLQDADVQVGIIESSGLGRLTRRTRIE